MSAILGSLPVQLYVFGTLNLASIVTSILVLNASAWIIRLGLPTVLLLCIPTLSAASAPLLFVTGLLIRYQNFVAEFVAKFLPGAIHFSGNYIQGIVILVTLFLLVAFWIFKGKPLTLPVYLLAAALLLTGTVADFLVNQNQVKLLVLQNDYAECSALVKGNRAAVLSCSGNSTTVSSLLENHGVKEIDLLLVGEKESESRCAEDLFDTFPVHETLVPDTVYFPNDSSATAYHYGTSHALWNMVDLQIASAGDSISLSIYGNPIVFDENRAAYANVECSVAVIDAPNSRVHGDLMILCGGNDLSEIANDMSAGRYILTNEHESLCLGFKPDGSYTIKHG